MNHRELIEREFEAIELPDVRLTSRAKSLARAIGEEPGASLPRITKDSSQLEGAYRLLRNERVMPDDLLSGHYAQTAVRIRASNEKGMALAVVHDGSQAHFGGAFRRSGTGILANGTQGHSMYPSLAVGVQGSQREPLGVLGITTLFRDQPKGRRSGKELAQSGDAESKVWLESILDSEARLPPEVKATHVIDREADAFHLMADLIQRNLKFVIRCKHDRRVQKDDVSVELLWNALEKVKPTCLTRQIHLEARHPGELRSDKALKGASYRRTLASKKVHPPRQERDATLQVAASSVVLVRPRVERTELPSHLTVNCIRVFEPTPPPGAEPVEWLLLTNRSVESTSDIDEVIDMYRARWLIEEFFKVLKTGLGYERLQLELRPALVNALAIFLPIAWVLLRLREIAQHQPDAPADIVLTRTQLAVLRTMTKKVLSEQPTASEVLLCIAAIGGHLKQNGPPGWLVLWRGFHSLLEREAGWTAALSSSRSDQS